MPWRRSPPVLFQTAPPPRACAATGANRPQNDRRSGQWRTAGSGCGCPASEDRSVRRRESRREKQRPLQSCRPAAAPFHGHRRTARESWPACPSFPCCPAAAGRKAQNPVPQGQAQNPEATDRPAYPPSQAGRVENGCTPERAAPCISWQNPQDSPSPPASFSAQGAAPRDTG